MSQVDRSIREVNVLQQATQMILSSLDVDTVLHQILLIVRNYFGASKCAVFLVEPSGSELSCRAQNGYSEQMAQQRLPVGKDSVAGWVAFTRAPLYVPDVSKEPRHRSQDPSIRAELALPLLVRERTLGVLEVASDRTDAFSSNAIGLLSVFAGQAAVALENARLYSTELRRTRQIELINLIARSAAAANDTPQFFSTLAELVADTFEGAQAAIVLAPAGGNLSVPAFAGGAEPQLERFTASRQSGSLAEVFSRRASFLVDHLAARPNWPACFPATGSELCVPLVSFGEVLGAVVLAHPQPRFFSPDDRSLAQAAADVCATAARNLQLTEELRRVVTLDPLTGVCNQRHFHSALAQEIPRARRHKKQFGLIALDLRRFRAVNSALGLERGDDLLCQVARTLKSSLRNNDVLCRYVADQFAVILPEVDAQGSEVVMSKLQQAVHAIQVPFPDAPCPLSAAWASANYPQDASEESALVKLLFSRLETAKRQASGAGA